MVENKTIKHISFSNKTNPKSYFEIVRIEELLKRDLDHDICKNHLVNFYIIIFIVEGQGYHTIDFTDHKYQKGTVLLIRKDQIHKFFRSTNVKGYLLIYTEEFLLSQFNKLETMRSLQLFNEAVSFPKIEISEGTEEFQSLIQIVKHMEHEIKLSDEYSIRITRSTLHILTSLLYRAKSNSGLLTEKKKYFEEFLAFQELVEKDCFKSKKVMDYAQKLGVSTKTLNKISQVVVKKTAKTFIDEIAIMQIKRLLISTNLPIKEVAYTTGFDDPANFFKYFKKYIGSSPEVFRKAYQ